MKNFLITGLALSLLMACGQAEQGTTLCHRFILGRQLHSAPEVGAEVARQDDVCRCTWRKRARKNNGAGDIEIGDQEVCQPCVTPVVCAHTRGTIASGAAAVVAVVVVVVVPLRVVVKRPPPLLLLP